MENKKTENNTWSSLVRTCEDEQIELADIIIHTKYPVNSERLFGFSVCTPQANVNLVFMYHTSSSWVTCDGMIHVWVWVSSV